MENETVHAKRCGDEAAPAPTREDLTLPLYESIHRRAGDHRSAFHGALKKTSFYPALEALIGFWLELEASYADIAELKVIQPLVVRGRQDVEVSIYLLDSGLYALVSDCARDLMEIEFLFRHFVEEPTTLGQWLAADEKTRKDKFSAAALRQAEANRRGVPVTSLPDSGDYKGHSQLLHVSLREIIPRGFTIEFSETLVPESMAMYEVLRHGQKTAWQVWKLAADRAGIESGADSSKFEKVDQMVQNVANALRTFGFPLP